MSPELLHGARHAGARGPSVHAPTTRRSGPNRTIIVDDRLAKRVWGSESPIGKPLQLEPTGTPNMNATVVGVVEATRMLGLDGYGLPAIYSPYPPWLTASYAVRTAGDPASLIPAVRREVAAMDASLPLSDLRPMQEYVEDALAGPRLSLLLMQGVGALALLLATIGIYGVISYSVNQRQREFGVRIALGETPSRLTRNVVLQGARLVGASVAIGLVGAAAATRLLSGLLYGVSPGDPLTFAERGAPAHRGCAPGLLWPRAGGPRGPIRSAFCGTIDRGAERLRLTGSWVNLRSAKAFPSSSVGRAGDC